MIRYVDMSHQVNYRVEVRARSTANPVSSCVLRIPLSVSNSMRRSFPELHI
jgi:hypothetical protein